MTEVKEQERIKVELTPEELEELLRDLPTIIREFNNDIIDEEMP